MDNIEIMARRKVKMSFVPVQLESPSMLYWCKQISRKKTNWYPCRECHQDEVIGLDLPQTWNKAESALVQFIEGTRFGKKSLVARNKLLPYGGKVVKSDVRTEHQHFSSSHAKHQNEIKAPCWCPSMMINMSKRNRMSKQKIFSTEECVKAMELYMVKVLETSIQRMKAKVEVQEEMENCSQLHETEELNQNLRQIKNYSPGSAIISQSQEEDDNYSSSDDFHSLSQQIRKKIPLRPGDIIEYYEPNQVFGDKLYLRSAEIEEINCQSEMIVRISGGVYLSKDQKVRLLKRILRGKLKDINGRWMKVEDYKLTSAKTNRTEKVGVAAHAAELKEIIELKKKEAIEQLKDKGLEKFSSFIK